MRLEAAAPARASHPPPIVAWTIVRWAGLGDTPLLTVLSPHKHIAETDAMQSFGGTTGDYDYRPVRSTDLPPDIAWRYVRAAPSELLRGDVAQVGEVVMTVTHSFRHEGGQLVMGLDLERDAVVRFCEWNERTLRVVREREKGVSLVGARVKIRRDGGERWGVVADVGSGHGYIVVQAAEDAARFDVALPSQEGWLGVPRWVRDIEAGRRLGRKAVKG